ncbi:hypothetical protein IAU60_002410 [Kwoniella sp. DSM 27419]
MDDRSSPSGDEVDSPVSYLSTDRTDLSPGPATFPPESPSASTFLRTAATLDGLAKQLGDIQDDTDTGAEGEVRCCCGEVNGCRIMRDRERLEDKLKLSGEVGNALLQRYEALERKYQREVDKYEHQLEVKRTALAESVKRVNNLEKANDQHMQRFADMSKKTEGLEKRYTQAMHTQTLTQQSLTHVRAELTTLRATSTRQNIALASGAGVEQRLADAEKRCEDAKDLAEAETRKGRDEIRKRRRAEARIEELEGQVKAATKEVESLKEARAKDAQDLLANAKDRLNVLHTELSETFSAESPTDMPEYQRTLEDLVAANALLQHDVAELSHSLTESRDEARGLKEEVEELRAVIGSAGQMSPFGRVAQHLASELNASHSSHNRTESSPILAWGSGHSDRTSWQRMSVASSSRTGGMSAWEHHRKMSMAASFTSTSTTDGVISPGLGMGAIGEFGGTLVNEDGSRIEALSPPPSDGMHSPKFRTSPNGISYVVNGVPKMRPPPVRPTLSRSFSTNTDRRKRRSYASQGVGPIAEWSGAEDCATAHDEPPSPGTDYFRAVEANRKRRSLMLARRSTMSPHDSGEYSPNLGRTVVDEPIVDDPSPMSDSVLTNTSPHKRAKRKTLLLLTRSQGVQTDPVNTLASTTTQSSTSSRRGSDAGVPPTSTGTSPVPPSEDRSETSSITEPRAGLLLVLIEHMSRMLARLRDADVPTLNKRLKKHNLPGDVAHLSQSTMRALQREVADLRNHFKGAQNLGGVDRKDFNLLLRLFKDVFTDLVDLQAIVNDITINPSLAKKLQRAAFKEEEDEAAKAAKQASGLGWIAAPITKFFVTPADVAEAEQAIPVRPGKGLDRSRTNSAPVKAVPKQQATSSATTTHVSVEFGGTGIVRRATPAVSMTGVAEGTAQPTAPLAESDLANRSISAATYEAADGGLAPPVMRTVRRSKSRANRNELLGIFAGAAPRSGPPSSSADASAVSGQNQPSAPGRRTLRSVSSQTFNDKTIRAREPINARKRISAVVDAVIDSSADQLDDNDRSIAVSGSYEPPLLERTLRPRGLSDSSIRSTFVSHAHPVEQVSDASMGGPLGRAQAYSGVTATGGGVFQTISKRWFDFRGPATGSEVTPVNPDGASTGAATHAKEDPTARPSSRAIPVSPSRSSSISTTASSRAASHDPSARGAAPTALSSSHTGTGLMGLIASSLGASQDMTSVGVGGGEDQDEELVGASLRQQPMLRSRPGKSWN